MTLHIINKSPDTNKSFKQSVPKLEEDAAVLLIEDGVYHAIKNTLPSSSNIFVLEEDLIARGIVDKIDPKCKTVSYTGFVELTEKHEKSITW